MKKNQTNTTVKRTFWIAFAFYFLIAFEFFYMVSPFALYFYSVYRPGLNFFNDSATFAWLSSIFLPHFVNETSSPILNLIMPIGFVLALLGFIGFVVGAGQVYYSKLTRKKAVTKGIYQLIRHPQYAALAVCGFGMLMLWPRYLVLLSYITMLFFYYILARIEEKECEQKFGEDYLKFKNKTGMFFPSTRLNPAAFIPFPSKGLPRIIATIALYVSTCVIGIFMANQLRDWSVDKLYAHYDNNSVTISVVQLDQKKIADLLNSANQNPEVSSRLVGKDDVKTLNYLVPEKWSASEIPMHQVAHSDGGHFSPTASDLKRLKIVFTEAVQRSDSKATGKDILFNTTQRIPLLEVLVDTSTYQVIEIIDPIENSLLQTVPLPLY